MGVIHEKAGLHLRWRTAERDLLVPFLANFDVTYAERKTHRGTELSYFFLAPERTIQDQFGITTEVLLVISDYASVQPRTMQAIENLLQEPPAKGRVDQTTFLFVTKNEDSKDWVENYTALNPQSRIPIVITQKDINEGRSNTWLVRQQMSDQMYSRDLFNEQLPLVNDLFFFGRDQTVAEFLNSAKLAQNRGLFGLRKTGKTSVLFKLRRIAETESILCMYYDCKEPQIRSLRWDALLDRISTDILSTRQRNPPPRKDDVHVSDRFKQIIRSVSAQQNVCIVFDEIEYISPVAKLDEHWRKDFVPFWQTLWATQSQVRKLSFIVAGVNPRVAEMDTVDDVQNPIFGIVTPQYLTGLSYQETRAMLYQFGKRMGLKFEHDSCLYMFERFGGHPLLTRMAGSYVNNAVKAKGFRRPFTVTRAFLEQDEEEREQELSFYCRHVTSELKLFYPEEYEMLEMLASGNEADFIELSRDANFVAHLRHYGLLSLKKGERPTFAIPVLGRFINQERIRNQRGRFEFFLVDADRRQDWLKNRLLRILADSRTLEAVARRNSLSPLYGPNGIPEAERFAGLSTVNSREEFESFINVCNRCFVEAIEALGKIERKKNYFWEEVKKDYPSLWEALRRIKLYRNNAMHLELRDKIDDDVRGLLTKDLRGKSLTAVPEAYFVLQQVVLDGLFVGFQLELDRFS